MKVFEFTIKVWATDVAPEVTFSTSVEGDDEMDTIASLFARPPAQWWPENVPFRADWRVVGVREQATH